MQCDKIYLTLISGHIDGSNSETEEKRLQQHLRSCPHCRELLQIMEGNDALLAQSQEQPPADLTARIMAEVRKEPKKKGKGKGFYFTTAVAGLATAALLCFALLGDTFPMLGRDSASHESMTYDAIVDDNNAPVSIDTEAPQEVAYETERATELHRTEDFDSPEAEATVDPEPENQPQEDFDSPDAEATVDPEPENQPQEDREGNTVFAPEVQESIASAPEPPQEQPEVTLPAVHASDSEIINGYSYQRTPDKFAGGYLYGEQSESVPTLVIWGAAEEDIKLPFSAVKSDFATKSGTAAKLSLYDHFASALFTLRQPSFSGIDGKKFLTPAYSSKLYTLNYEELCDLFRSCTGKFELAVYFPKALTNLENCQVILIAPTSGVTE